MSKAFGPEYYKRFYRDQAVHNKTLVTQLGTAVFSMCKWWGLTPRSLLDIGSGPGFLRDWCRDNHPNVRLLSTDVSEYACTKYGHLRSDIASWSPPRPFDVTFCHGVLQYLEDADVVRAIENIAKATRHVLYLEIPTTLDFSTVVDTTKTDLNVHQRSGDWYRKLLNPFFVQAGAGLWVRRGGKIVLYELEGTR